MFQLVYRDNKVPKDKAAGWSLPSLIKKAKLDKLIGIYPTSMYPTNKEAPMFDTGTELFKDGETWRVVHSNPVYTTIVKVVGEGWTENKNEFNAILHREYTVMNPWMQSV